MTYRINKTDGSILVDLLDEAIDAYTTDITLIGKNVPFYGEYINENFIRILENFASKNSPQAPITGQLWYDKTSKKLKVYDGIEFKAVGGAIVKNTRPLVLTEGDIWVDSAENQLHFYDGTDLILTGPIYKITQGRSGFTTDSLTDATGFTRTVLRLWSGSNLVGVFSKDQNTFVLQDSLSGFSGDISTGFNEGTIPYAKFNVTTTSSIGIFDAAHELKIASDFMLTDDNTGTIGTVTLPNKTPLLLGPKQNFSFVVNNGLRIISNNTNQNFSISASNSTKSLYINAVDNLVGIFNSTPTTTLDVSGSANVTGILYASLLEAVDNNIPIGIQNPFVELQTAVTTLNNYAGLFVDRAPFADSFVRWNEDLLIWEVSENGVASELMSLSDLPAIAVTGSYNDIIGNNSNSGADAYWVKITNDIFTNSDIRIGESISAGPQLISPTSTVYPAVQVDGLFRTSNNFENAVDLQQVLTGITEIDLSRGNYFVKTVNENTVITPINVSASGTVSFFILELINSGAFIVRWPTKTRWNSPPQLSFDGTDVLGFYTHDGGESWHGVIIAKNIIATVAGYNFLEMVSLNLVPTTHVITAVDKVGDLYTAVMIQNAGNDINIICKFSKTGSLRWCKSLINDTSTVNITCMATSPDGTLVVAGYSMVNNTEVSVIITFNEFGNIILQKSLGSVNRVSGLAIDSNGIFITGSLISQTNKIYVAKLTLTLSLVWERTADPISTILVPRYVLLTSEGIGIVGSFNNSIFYIRYDYDGTLGVQRSYDTVGNISIEFVTSSATTVIITGSILETAYQVKSGIVLMIDALEGRYVTARQINDNTGNSLSETVCTGAYEIITQTSAELICIGYHVTNARTSSFMIKIDVGSIQGWTSIVWNRISQVGASKLETINVDSAHLALTSTLPNSLIAVSVPVDGTVVNQTSFGFKIAQIPNLINYNTTEVYSTVGDTDLPNPNGVYTWTVTFYDGVILLITDMLVPVSIVSTSASGWVSMSETTPTRIRTVVDSQGNVYCITTLVSPTLYNYLVITKYTGTGTLIFQKNIAIDLNSLNAYDIAIDSQNNIIVLGQSYDTENAAAWPYGIVFKLDSNGNLLWVYQMTYDILSDTHVSQRIVCDSNDNIYLGMSYSHYAGTTFWSMYHIIKINESGNQVWQNVYSMRDLTDLTIANDKIYVVHTPQSSADSFSSTINFFEVVELSLDGIVLSVCRINWPVFNAVVLAQSRYGFLTVGADNAVYGHFCVEYADSFRSYVFKIVSGALEWTKVVHVETGYWHWPNSIVFYNNALYLVGYARYEDSVIIKFDTLGNVQSTHLITMTTPIEANLEYDLDIKTLAFYNNNIYLSGGTEQRSFVIKLLHLEDTEITQIGVNGSINENNFSYYTQDAKYRLLNPVSVGISKYQIGQSVRTQLLAIGNTSFDETNNWIIIAGQNPVNATGSVVIYDYITQQEIINIDTSLEKYEMLMASRCTSTVVNNGIMYVVGQHNNFNAPTWTAPLCFVFAYDLSSGPNSIIWVKSLSGIVLDGADADRLDPTIVLFESGDLLVTFTDLEQTNKSIVCKISCNDGAVIWSKEILVLGLGRPTIYNNEIYIPAIGAWWQAVHLFKLDINGNYIWSLDYLTDVSTVSINVNNQGIFLNFQRTSFSYLVKFDLTGAVVWAKELGLLSQIKVYNNAIFVAGTLLYDGPEPGTSWTMIVVAKLSIDGNVIWANSLIPCTRIGYTNIIENVESIDVYLDTLCIVGNLYVDLTEKQVVVKLPVDGSGHGAHPDSSTGDNDFPWYYQKHILVNSWDVVSFVPSGPGLLSDVALNISTDTISVYYSIREDVTYQQINRVSIKEQIRNDSWALGFFKREDTTTIEVEKIILVNNSIYALMLPADPYVILAKFSLNGSLIWQFKANVGSWEILHGPIIDDQENMYLVGQGFFDGTTTQSFVVKLTSTGMLEWKKITAGVTPANRWKRLTFDNQGNILILAENYAEVGCFIIKMSPAGEVLKVKSIRRLDITELDGCDILCNAVGEIYVAGLIWFDGYNAAHVIKLQTLDAIEWECDIGFLDNPSVVNCISNISLLSTGEVCVISRYIDAIDYDTCCISLISATGTLVWAKHISPIVSWAHARAVVDTEDNIYLTATIIHATNIVTALIKFSSAGIVLWSNVLENIGSTSPITNLIVYADNLYIGGYTNWPGAAICKLFTDGTTDGSYFPNVNLDFINPEILYYINSTSYTITTRTDYYGVSGSTLLELTNSTVDIIEDNTFSLFNLIHEYGIAETYSLYYDIIPYTTKSTLIEFYVITGTSSSMPVTVKFSKFINILVYGSAILNSTTDYRSSMSILDFNTSSFLTATANKSVTSEYCLNIAISNNFIYALVANIGVIKYDFYGIKQRYWNLSSDYVSALVVTPVDEIYVNRGPNLVKIANDLPVWSLNLFNGINGIIWDACIDFNNAIVISAYYSGTPNKEFLIKLLDNEILWSKLISSPFTGRKLKVCSSTVSNAIYFAGNNAENSVYVAKINVIGNLLWGKTFTSTTQVTGLVTDILENIYISSGNTIVKISPSGDLLWTTEITVTQGFTNLSVTIQSIDIMDDTLVFALNTLGIISKFSYSNPVTSTHQVTPEIQLTYNLISLTVQNYEPLVTTELVEFELSTFVIPDDITPIFELTTTVTNIYTQSVVTLGNNIDIQDSNVTVDDVVITHTRVPL